MNLLNRRAASLVMRDSSYSKGAALIEGALILPLMVMLLLFGIETARVIYTYNTLTVAARELTGAAYRRCSLSAFPNPAGSTDELKQVIDECLTDVLTDASTVYTPSVPQLQIMLSVWRWNYKASKSGAPERWAFQSNSEDLIFKNSKIQDSHFTKTAWRSDLLRNQRVLVYGEVTAPYKSFFSFIARRFSYKDGTLNASACF